MKNYLSLRYEFRYNHLREMTEWRPAPAATTTSLTNAATAGAAATAATAGASEWRELDSWSLNSIYCEVLEAGFDVAFGDLRRMLMSCFCTSFHPFADYLAHLPRWDGRDRITPLAARVSDDPLWTLVLHRWMLAMVAQWKGLDLQTANSMVPVLVSQRQGLGKSTFWRSIVPRELQAYYLDKLEFTTGGEYDRMMAQCCLINLDEMDVLTDRAMSKFKAATQMKSITGHSTLRTRITVSRRMASFCGTTNQRAILRDRTGSRRFFCQEVTGKISCGGIQHTQIYAQLLAELEAGERTWFTKKEELRIQHHNRMFYAPTPVQQALTKFFRAPLDVDSPDDVQHLSTHDLMRALARRYSPLVSTMDVKELGRQAAMLFPRAKRTNTGLLFKVVALKA